MQSWFRAIMPEEDRFLDHFEAHARVLLGGAKALHAPLAGAPDIPAAAAEVKRHENAADDITADVLPAVRRCFGTPSERIDIKNPIWSMDDAIDQMDQTSKAIPLLRKIGANAAEPSAHAVEITELEGRADELHDRGLKELFLAHRNSDPMAYTIGAEIDSHLERVADRFEDVAAEISDIVIEHV